MESPREIESGQEVIIHCDHGHSWKIPLNMDEDGQYHMAQHMAFCQICDLLSILRKSDDGIICMNSNSMSKLFEFECSKSHIFVMEYSQKTKMTSCPLCSIENTLKNHKREYIKLYTNPKINTYYGTNSILRFNCEKCKRDIISSEYLISMNLAKFIYCKSHNTFETDEQQQILLVRRIFEIITEKPCEYDKRFGKYQPTCYNREVNFIVMISQNIVRGGARKFDKYVDVIENVAEEMNKMVIYIGGLKNMGPGDVINTILYNLSKGDTISWTSKQDALNKYHNIIRKKNIVPAICEISEEYV